MDIWIAENFWWMGRQTDKEVIYVVVLNVCLSKKEGQIKSLCIDTEMELIFNYISSNSMYFHQGNRYKP